MSHSWEIKEKDNVNIKIPSGFKSYQIGSISLFKLINSDKGKYKDAEEVSIAVKNLIVKTELKRLKSVLKKIKGSNFKSVDTVFYKNKVESLIKNFEKNAFENLSLEIEKMIRENINGGKLSSYEMLIDNTIHGYKNFWTKEYPELEKYESLYLNFKKNTLNSLNNFEKSIKFYKNNLKNIDRTLFKELDRALSIYEIELNSSSIIKKNHIFKKSISNDNLLEQNYKDISKFESWMKLETLIKKAVETTSKIDEEKNILQRKYKELNIQFEKYEFYMKATYFDFSKEVENFLADFEERFEKLSNPEIFSLKSEINNLCIKLDTFIEKVNKPEKTIKQFLDSKDFNFLIIRGKAGTGKTTLIKQIIKTYYKNKTLLPILKDIINSKEVIVSAPTRVACANIRHRKIWHSRTIQHIVTEFENKKKRGIVIDSDLDKTKLLILDESSMVGKILFKRINNIFKHHISSGKLKIVFIGDDAQLTPPNEPVSPTLSKKELDETYNSSLPKSGLELDLEIDFRLSSSFNSEYISFLEDLRNTKIDHKNIIKDMNSRLLENNSVGVVEEDNRVVSFFNKWVDIGINVKNRLDNEESFDEILYSLKKKDSFENEQFSMSEIFSAFEMFKNQTNYRPKLVELYSKFYPNVEKRIKNPKDLNTVISLFRSNEQVAHVNMDIRKYLFNHELKNDEYICRGEVLKVERTAFNESLYDDESLYRGDTFVLVSEPHQISGDFYEVKLCKINQNIRNPIKLFLDKFLNVDKTLTAVIWTGGLRYLNENNGKYLEDKELNSKFKEDIKNMSKSSDQNFIDKINKSYCVSYDYAKVTYGSQGGEWDTVIIQSGDIWTNNKDAHRYVYTAFTRAREKVYLYS